MYVELYDYLNMFLFVYVHKVQQVKQNYTFWELATFQFTHFLFSAANLFF